MISGTNVQFAHHPETGRVVVIGSTRAPRAHRRLPPKGDRLTHRSHLGQACGRITLNELPYWRDGTLDRYTPSGDYVVVKFARWAFEKFPGSLDQLGTQMRAVGEVMSIGKTYKEAFQKAIRSLETRRYGLRFAGLPHAASEELRRRLVSLLRAPVPDV